MARCGRLRRTKKIAHSPPRLSDRRHPAPCVVLSQLPVNRVQTSTISRVWTPPTLLPEGRLCRFFPAQQWSRAVIRARARHLSFHRRKGACISSQHRAAGVTTRALSSDLDSARRPGQSPTMARRSTTKKRLRGLRGRPPPIQRQLARRAVHRTEFAQLTAGLDSCAVSKPLGVAAHPRRFDLRHSLAQVQPFRLARATRFTHCIGVSRRVLVITRDRQSPGAGPLGHPTYLGDFWGGSTRTTSFNSSSAFRRVCATTLSALNHVEYHQRRWIASAAQSC
jgi:hypothetical protein